MKTPVITSYETYREIMGELLNPIMAQGLDADTLKRLYESKAVYLENLRIKCFVELNGKGTTHFNKDDYTLILTAIKKTREHLRKLIMLAVAENLSRRKVS
jgi:hypothetical protein